MRIVVIGILVVALCWLAPCSHASGAAVRPLAVCHSTRYPTLAARLSRDLLVALGGRRTVAGVALDDGATGIRCRVGATRRFDTASAVKVTILAALLRRNAERGQAMTGLERSLATRMITRSDNAAATALWRDVTVVGMARFLRLAGMEHTTIDPAGHWGLTRTTAADQERLLDLLSRPGGGLLDARDRAYELRLMGRVAADQRWGAPAGAPPGVAVSVKNGWLPRATRGWRINTLGVFRRAGDDYTMAVLSDDNPSMAYGIASVERVARVVHRDLNARYAPAAVESAATVPTHGRPRRPDRADLATALLPLPIAAAAHAAATLAAETGGALTSVLSPPYAGAIAPAT